MTNHNFLSAALISAAMIATPAIAHASDVSRLQAQAADASASPTANHIHGRVGISAVRSPAPPDGESCDVGDNPRIC